MKVHTLIVDEKPGVRLFGIVHGDKFHLAAWKLNKILPFPLERIEDIKLDLNGKESYFGRYSAFDPDMETEIIFLKNRGTFGYLIQEFKQFDFLLMERNYDCDFIEDLQESVILAGIEHVIPVDFENLRPQSRVNLEI